MEVTVEELNVITQARDFILNASNHAPDVKDWELYEKMRLLVEEAKID